MNHSERFDVINVFNDKKITLDVDYNSHWEKKRITAVEITGLITDEGVRLLPFLSEKYIENAEIELLAQAKDYHE